MQRRLLIAVSLLIFLLVFRACGGCGNEGEIVSARKQRLITPEQLLHLAQNDNQPLRLRTTQDVLPGGLSAAMAPMLIDWEASEIDRPDGFVIVHNLNYGGNPVEGTTVLQTVKVPLDGVEKVEWILVPLSRGGKRAAIHHGQLRFVFKKDRPLELMDLTSEKGGGDSALYDLVVSWEAWRPPGQDYNVLTGMDADAYALGLRLYAGPQRFLEDGLSGRDWFATELRIPGGPEGLAEVLKVTLAMGDGVARHTISEAFAKSSEGLMSSGLVEDADKLDEQWTRLEELTRPRDVVKDARVNIPAEERTYQSVLRSCATVAYYNVVVAVERLAERDLTDGLNRDNLDKVRLSGDEPWMAKVSDTNLGGLALRAPLAVRWLRNNPQAIPSKINGRLDKAGLVKHKDGKPIEIHYSLGGLTPYGKMSENLLR